MKRTIVRDLFVCVCGASISMLAKQKFILSKQQSNTSVYKIIFALKLQVRELQASQIKRKQQHTEMHSTDVNQKKFTQIFCFAPNRRKKRNTYNKLQKYGYR